MTTAEKLSMTSRAAAHGSIILFREGNFMKAYDESAFLFVSHLKPYQVNRSFVKTVGKEVYSLGFPYLSTEKILSGTVWRNALDGTIEVDLPAGATFDGDGYAQWRDGVRAQPRPAKHPSSENLQCFKVAYELLLEFYKVNANVCREYKFSLSEKIKSDLMDVLLSIYALNDLSLNSEDRLAAAKSAIRHLRSAKIGVRLLHDLKQLSQNRFASFADSFTTLLQILAKQEDVSK